MLSGGASSRVRGRSAHSHSRRYFMAAGGMEQLNPMVLRRESTSVEAGADASPPFKDTAQRYRRAGLAVKLPLDGAVTISQPGAIIAPPFSGSDDGAAHLAQVEPPSPTTRSSVDVDWPGQPRAML